MSAELLAAVRKRRELWVDLGDGRRVRGRVPGTRTSYAMLATHEQRIDSILRCADGWDGVTVGDIAPDMPNPDAHAPFSLELWCEIADERTDWGGKFVNAMLDAFNRAQEAREAASGN